MGTTRREFLTTAAGIGALAAAASAAWPQAEPRAEKPAMKAPPFRISLAEWSYHKALQKGEMDHRDFAKVAKQVHHIEAVEYVNTFMKDKVSEGAYVKELRSRADDFGVRILLVMCDAEGELGSADASKRTQAVENHKKWLDAARSLGCHSIRVNVHGTGTRAEHMAQAADGLRALAEVAEPMDLNVIVENHGGITSDGAWLAGVMKKAAHPRAGTLPDFGNFTLADGTQYDRYEGVAELMPWAKAVSAKCFDFDARGEETTIDFKRMTKIVLDAGYHGHMGIEYEGERMSEKDGIEAMRKLLERVRDEQP